MTETQRFETLVARHQGAVCGVAYAVLRDRARSEEIAQEAFLVAWQKLPALAVPPAMPAWICGIARNLARNAARRRTEVPMSDDDVVAAPTGTPLDEVIDREEAVVAQAALAQLSETDRELVVLYYRGDETAEAVADALGTTPVNVRKRLERARTRLRAAAAAVEASLRRTRPGPAFTAGCVVAFGALAAKGAKAATVAAAAKSATAARRVTSGKVALAAAAIVVLGGGLVGAVAWHAASAAPRGIAGSAGAREAPEPVLTALPASATPPPARAAATIADGSAAAALAQLHARRAPRTAAADVPVPDEPARVYDFSDRPLDDLSPLPPPPHPDRIDKATLRAAVREIQPLLIECLRTQPLVTGSLTLRVDIASEANEQATVDSVIVAGEIGFAADAEATRCLTEAVYTLQLPTTTDASRIAFIYSLTR